MGVPCTIYNMSGRTIYKNTHANAANGLWNSQISWSIGEVLLTTHLILDEKTKVKVIKINRIRYLACKLLHAHDFFCVFFMTYLWDLQCKLKHTHYRPYSKAHSHSHSMSGGSFWACLGCYCRLWVARWRGSHILRNDTNHSAIQKLKWQGPPLIARVRLWVNLRAYIELIVKIWRNT